MSTTGSDKPEVTQFRPFDPDEIRQEQADAWLRLCSQIEQAVCGQVIEFTRDDGTTVHVLKLSEEIVEHWKAWCDLQEFIAEPGGEALAAWRIEDATRRQERVLILLPHGMELAEARPGEAQPPGAAYIVGRPDSGSTVGEGLTLSGDPVIVTLDGLGRITSVAEPRVERRS